MLNVVETDSEHSEEKRKWGKGSDIKNCPTWYFGSDFGVSKARSKNPPPRVLSAVLDPISNY